MTRARITALLFALVLIPASASLADEGLVWLDFFDFELVIDGEAIESAQADPTKAEEPDEALTTDGIVDGIQSFYETAASFSADFEQTMTDISGLERTSTGVVWFKMPGRMRWDYATPEEKYFISNGTTFWAWEPAYRQYCQQELESSQLPTALTFLSGQGDIRKDFTVEFKETLDAGHRLELTPKVPSSSYASLEFIVDPSSYQVKRVTILDALGNQNTVTFKNPELNADLPDANFNFSPPSDATQLCK